MMCWRTRAGLKHCGEVEVILVVPHVRQAESYSCGRAAVEMCFRFHAVRGRKPQATSFDGTDPRSIEASLRLAGLPVQSGQMTLDDLRHHTRAGRPVIALVTTESGHGHYVVVAGVERGGVHFLDPDAGPEVVRRRADEFVAAWADSDRLGVRYECWGIATG